MSAGAAVRVDNLSVRFGGADAATVTKRVSLTIAPGECLALVGESGSGKSVTARALVGLAGPGARISADRLEVAGRDVLSLGRRQLERLRGGVVGTISQDALVALDPLRLVGREVDDALRLHTRLSVVQRRERVLELLTESGIPDAAVRASQRSGELSGGLRQRALIAAAIAAGPAVLLADEPTTALDAELRGGILELISRQAAAGVAVLLISHDIDAVRQIADRVAVMKDGTIVEEGTTAEVLSSPSHPYTRLLLAASPSGKPRHTLLLAQGSPAAGPEPAADGVDALTAESLTVAFPLPGGGSRTVLNEVSFTLSSGETLGLVGPSGSGKTTVARVALGLQKPDAGELLLLGEPWSNLPERERRPRRGSIGAVYQDPLGSFDPRFTVSRLLTDAIDGRAGIGDRACAARVAELLDNVGLTLATAERRPRTLSGGQRQRVAIARALAARPRVLVLDEPVSSLDVSIQAQILDLLDNLQRELGLSYLFISHDIDVIDHMSDRVLRLA
ncbi:MAG TPA: ABC transporter ATP-binding protein [Leifsonia sp.]|jgi:peptide/nickel transport system ATP-binding protein|nr:ABC transporter ATP-binding protein [Leifsonia sp.]